MAQKFLNGIVSTGNILPSADSTYDLGHGSYRWANINADAINTTSTFVAGGTIALNSSISTLNKAQTSYISFATRNTSGSETLMDLTNVGDATFAGKVGAGLSPSTSLHVSGSSLTNKVAALIGGGWVGNDAYHKEGGLLLISGTNDTQTGAGIAFQTRNTQNTNYWKSSIIMDRDGALRFTLGGAGTVAGSNDFTILSGGNAIFAGDVGMATGHSSGKFAVMSTSVHGSYDFYNNGTSYFNGAVTVDAAFTQSGGGASTFSGSVTIPGAISAGANGGIRIHSGGTKFFNVTAANAAQDATMDVGASDARFKDAYFSGTVTATAFTGTSSNAALLDNIDSNQFAYYNALTFVDGTEKTNRSSTHPTPHRSAAVYPASYGRTFHTEFKQKTGNINPGCGSSWTGIVSMAPYNTGTNFYTTQIAMGADGTNKDLYVRRGNGTGNGTWGDWRQIITTDSTTEWISAQNIRIRGGASTPISGEVRLGGHVTWGAQIYGYGSTNDISLYNRSGTIAMAILGNTVNATFAGSATFASSVTSSSGTSQFSVVNASAYQLNGTYIVDSSRNLVNISKLRFGSSDAVIDTASVTSATATTVVASVVHATYAAAFFDFVIKNGTNVRAGVVYACHDGTTVSFTETSTVDLGDTSDVTLDVVISGTNMVLRATTTSSTWTIKSLIRTI